MSLFRIISVAGAIFLLSYCQTAYAVGSAAYRVELPDAGVGGKGFAFVGEANTPAAIYYNPAGINQMTTAQISVGDAFIAPRAEMTQSNGNKVHEQNNEYNIPNIYVVIPVISKLSVGYGSGSYWGLGTNWGPNSPLQYATTQASIKDMDNSLVASYQVTPQWSIALSADNDFSKADESYSLNNFGTTSRNGVAQLRGSDDAWGYRIATLLKINDQNQVGLMYRSRINHNYSGKLSINEASPTIYGLSTFVAPVNLKTVLPQSVTMGYSFKPTTKWTINVDIDWTDWSSTKYQTINVSNPTLVALGVGTPTPQNWHSAWSESIGTQYDIADNFRVRLGYYHLGRVIPNATFNPNIPDSNSNGYTAGFGFDFNTHLTLDIAYSALIYDARTITNSVASTNAGVAGSVDGKYKQFVHMGLASLTYKF